MLSGSMHQGAGPGTELASGVGCRARQKRGGKPGSIFSNYLLRFSQTYYDYVSGNLETVKQFIALAATKAHVEITTLIVPGKNDSAEEMDALASFLASVSPDIPLHLTRYFPRWHEKTPATLIETLKSLQETAGRHLNNVFLGNV